MENTKDLQKAYFAGGCFWGVEYHLRRVPGVVDVISGFMGGVTPNPTYRQVCTGTTGHIETVEVAYDPATVSYEAIARRFFEIHDPTQQDRQGPDVGEQYKSVAFYVDDAQKTVAQDLIRRLRENGYDVATELRPAETFWPAEDYHQRYYDRAGCPPSCHFPVDRFSGRP